MRHTTAILRGIAAVITGVVILVGVPVGLISFVGWPLPTTLPSVDEIQLALRSGIDPDVLINTLAIIVWIVWIQIVVAVVVETAAAFRGAAARNVPVLPGLQHATAHLVAAVTLAVATLGPLRIPAAATPLPVAIVTSETRNTAQTADQNKPILTSAPASIRDSDVDLPTYRVLRHDTLWSIAETTLDDPRRWKDIRDLNVGQIMHDGSHFTSNTDRLSPGWLLTLPSDAAIPEPGVFQAGNEVTVEHGDNFWAIAKATLKTSWGRTPSNAEVATYWRQLIDVNQDRLEPPHDPNLIYPGQVFELPPIPTHTNLDSRAPTLAAETEHAETAIEGEITVKPGDTFWSIAKDTLTGTLDRVPSSTEIANYSQQLINTNLDRLEPPNDPNLIYPGQALVLPSIPGDTAAPVRPEAPVEQRLRSVPTPVQRDEPPHTEERDTAEPEVPSTVVPPAVTMPDRTPQTPEPAPNVIEPEIKDPTRPDSETEAHQGPGSDLLPIASTAAGLGILAAGLVALLRRLRRVQMRQRRPGKIPTPPPPDTVTTENTIRAAAAPASSEFVDIALRSMARDIIETHAAAPDVVGVHLTPYKLQLLLWTKRQNPPPPWQVEDDGRSWTIPTDTDLTRLRATANRIAAPYPTLVSVGHQDRAQLLLNLEYLGATQITGHPDDVIATCSTMATELAASPTGDGIQTFCVGFGQDLAHLERIHVVDTIADVLPIVETKTAAISQIAAPSPLHGRTALPGGDTWDPIVVFHPSADPTEGTDRLLAIAHTGRAVAAVVGYPTGSRWCLHIDNTTVRIEPLGSTLARRNLTRGEQAAVADLVVAAKDLEGIPHELAVDPVVNDEPHNVTPLPSDVPLETPQPHKTSQQSNIAAHTTPQMKILGTLRVDGLDGHFPLRKCTEFVTYLSFHRHGVEADTLMEALWPDQAPDLDRLNRHTSRTRTTLGLGPDGEYLLPYIRDGRYRISPNLQSDFEFFSDHIRQADRTTGAEEANHLRAALELVEGIPFTEAGNAYTWAHTDGIITHAIVAIDDAAHRLSDHALAIDDPEQATWAARKGLIATEICEECYRNLMRAAIEEGHHVALEAIYTELLAVIDVDDGPDASTFLDPETVELYERESRKHRRQAG